MRAALAVLALLLAACQPSVAPVPAPAPVPAVLDSGATVPDAGTTVAAAPEPVIVAVVERTTIVALTPPPARANQFRADMTRSAYRVFGPSAPVATLAAQIHQESGWRADARSPVGALGIAQFMPATAEDMARQHPADCAPADPFSPRWAFTCRDRYMHSRLAAIRPMTARGLDECDDWVFALRAYNGGLGWIQRDRRLAFERGADPDDWRAVQAFNAGRSAPAFRENTDYGPKILTAQARYEQAGWGRGVCP